MQLTMIRQTTAPKDQFTSDMDTILNSIGFGPNIKPLTAFSDMWYNIFFWAMVSSVFIHTVAAIIAFLTLRKHAVGRFYSMIIMVMGILTTLTTAAVTSACIAFIYNTSGQQMPKFHVVLWGVGQTFCGASFGFTRILATL